MKPEKTKNETIAQIFILDIRASETFIAREAFNLLLGKEPHLNHISSKWPPHAPNHMDLSHPT